MIQGTMSGVGKSLITAGLCRVFVRMGFRAAPFKSQNMALNSFITEEGLEMGRAQAVQAQAAGIQPSVRMNPILLKPTSDIGSQVIVNGEVVGTMTAQKYFVYKKSLIPQIREAYESLAAESDIIVIEGAGSPAEINLKKNDIVNMGMAELANAPVLLTGDIDRGGVFAQLVGTQILLTGAEQDRIKGFLINKFRGDRALLEPGLKMLFEKTGKPTLGVIPYLDVDLEDEDSLTDRFLNKNEGQSLPLKATVIKLPRISNFTDFLTLSNCSCIELNYAGKPSELAGADLIILPGTKNTMADLEWLRSSGMEKAVLSAYREGAVLFGICGGYQMLGEELSDPYHAEEGGTMQGMGLLPVRTVYAKKKTRSRMSGNILEIKGALRGLSGLPAEGYEIHMGDTKPCTEEKAYLTKIRDMRTGEIKTDGYSTDRVYGTYLHGFFDREEIVIKTAEILLQRKGLPAEHITVTPLHDHREKQFDKLADALQEGLEMDRILQIARLA